MEANPHATLNAALNASSAVFLLLGYRRIRSDPARWKTHRALMLAALAFSLAFLTSYVIYHSSVGSVPYPYHDWTRALYFAVLIPHVILAVVIVPFIVVLVVAALRGRFDRHRRIARRVWPAWIFVSLSGVAVYALLYLPRG
ncbi:MAG: hypothetical protein MAG453_00751 [Calditrichaeota bacterium]|nr:hypothetical protein [Calditrichota bacterium]